LDESCTSNPKSEIGDWTGRFPISDFEFEVQDSSNFEMFPLGFVRKFLDRLHAVAQRLQKRLSPPGGRIRDGFLVHLFIRLSEIPHRQPVRSRIFLNGNPEFDNLIALLFVDRVKVQLRQLLALLRLCKSPFRHGARILPQNSPA